MDSSSDSRLPWVIALLVLIGVAAAWTIRDDDAVPGQPNVGTVISSQRAAIEAIVQALTAILNRFEHSFLSSGHDSKALRYTTYSPADIPGEVLAYDAEIVCSERILEGGCISHEIFSYFLVRVEISSSALFHRGTLMSARWS